LDDGGAGVCAGAVTVTVADADLFDCALLVAVTVSVPAFAGAEYNPDELIVPSAAVQVTVVSVTVPCTDAENCFVPPVLTLAVLGETEIEVTTGVAPGAVTVTVAEPDLVLSATLVAVIVSAPALAGAV